MSLSIKQKAKNHLATPVNLKGLSPAQQRMLIATDAIAQLDAKVTRAESGIYFEAVSAKNKVGLFEGLGAGNAPVNEAVTSAERCTVCALGACFAATVTRFKPKMQIGGREATLNTFPANFPAGYENDSPTATRAVVEVGPRAIRTTLRKYFSSAQIGLMESAFEKRGDFFLSAINRRKLTEENRVLVERAINFGESYSTDAKRLRAILNNVVENCGEFKP